MKTIRGVKVDGKDTEMWVRDSFNEIAGKDYVNISVIGEKSRFDVPVDKVEELAYHLLDVIGKLPKQPEEVLREAMGEISELIDSNIAREDKVKTTKDDKMISNWNGQKHGLRHALGVVSDVRNTYR
ncbi:hypothetical protein [Bacillus mycoides]|uniref:hypothetical protein n=1 Tax=Bacillus mycoides TaxID=1405 RepID=UPI003A80DE13